MKSTKGTKRWWCAAVFLALPLAGSAQIGKPLETATNVAGVTAIAGPPEGLHVLTASDEQLAAYGFPPRPDQGSSPKAYASWAKAISASRKRLLPILEQTSLFHGPVRMKEGTESSENIALASYNWSGLVDLNGATRFGTTSFYALAADVVVPIANVAFGTCSGESVYGSSWVGMDGDSSSDVLQAGIEFDAFCSGTTTEALYSPWFEWYPAAEMRITNLPASPGDDFYIEIWNTSATQAYAYLVNESLDEAVTISFHPPSGTKLVGNSAEWITERPQVDGEIATLTNYIADPFWNAYGLTHSNRAFDPGSCQQIIMLDDNNVEISYPTLLGDNAFVMQDIGSAQ